MRPTRPTRLVNLLTLTQLASLALLAPVHPRAEPSEPYAAALPSDPVADQLVSEALQHLPELRQADSALQAERERVPQAGAMPDPTLTIGIQNDGFKGIEIGTMETSFWQVMITQPVPWPGKRGLRERVAGFDVTRAQAALDRARLSTEAEVRRSYLDLIRVRDALRLLGQLDRLWQDAEAQARTRYQLGQAPQSDLLRAQLERARLRQRRWSLEADEHVGVDTLNRLRGHASEDPVETTASLTRSPLPPAPALDQAIADAEARSPELAQAAIAEQQAGARVSLAERDRLPDFTVSAGIMPRGGLDPMWTASVGITLPIFSGKGHAVAESQARQASTAMGTQAIRHVLQLRVRERTTRLASLAQVNALYRNGLLIQSEATVESAEAQYRVGRATFASVLEALNAYVADQQGYIDSAAAALRLAIAQREVSLETAGGGASASGLPGSVPGAGGIASGSAGAGSTSGGSSNGESAPSAGGGMAKGM
jgi:outer membrane protein TolC